MTIITGRRKTLMSGLISRLFDTYFADNMGTLTTPTDVTTVTDIKDAPIGTTDTILYRGYFLPNTTSTTWQFRTTSDDASYVWIGTNSTATDVNLNTSNAVVNNGGSHSERTRTSGNISLTAGNFYPFAVVAGNNTGPGIVTLEWSTDGASWSDDIAQFIFHNPGAPNGFNLE